MPQAEISIKEIAENGRGQVAELLIEPRTKALYPVVLKVDFGHGNQASMRLGDFQSRLVVNEYSPVGAAMAEYIGGYQITYEDPEKQRTDGIADSDERRANRIIVVQRREFRAKVFNRNGNISYSAEQDVIAVTGVSATKKVRGYEINSSIKAGPILIRQHETSSPDTLIQKAIDLVVQPEAATINTPYVALGYEDDILTLSDARPQSPLGIAINLDTSGKFVDYDVKFPSTSYTASLVIRNSNNPRTVNFENRVLIPESAFEGGGIMINAEVRGWEPVLPSFMKSS